MGIFQILVGSIAEKEKSYGPFAVRDFNQSYGKHEDPVIWLSDAEFLFQLE